jgi:hypothetical protein
MVLLLSGSRRIRKTRNTLKRIAEQPIDTVAKVNHIDSTRVRLSTLGKTTFLMTTSSFGSPTTIEKDGSYQAWVGIPLCVCPFAVAVILCFDADEFVIEVIESCPG